jgi:hypothetical protein
MEVWDKLLRPDVLGPLIVILIVVGVSAAKILPRYFEHRERIVRIEAGLDPEDDKD